MEYLIRLLKLIIVCNLFFPNLKFRVFLKLKIVLIDQKLVLSYYKEMICFYCKTYLDNLCHCVRLYKLIMLSTSCAKTYGR